MKDLLIIGSGGVGRDVLNIIDRSYKNNFSKIYFLDDNFSLGKLINGIEVVGKTKDLNKFSRQKTEVIIAIGNPILRRKFHKIVVRKKYNLFSLIDKSVIIKNPVKIGKGVIILPNSIVSQDTAIGDNTLIDTNVIVGHDVIIKDNCVISPMACVLGKVIIESQVEVGCGAQIYLNVKVGRLSKIAMGSSVYKDVPKLFTVAGNPARKIRDNSNEIKEGN
ncbi:MAG: hypothetical protein CMF54_07800 [Legionellales bacterium]|nr:hypothetical protein [Legionellales bacterium]